VTSDGSPATTGDGPVRIAATVVDAIIAHAREAAPRECCGLLLGSADRIEASVRTRNLAPEPTRFLIDPKGHIDGRRHARERGLDVVGFYHSHARSAAFPSERDRDEAGYPDHLYMIVSLREPSEARLFRLTAGNFVEVPFVTVA
jgi:proteasome lid subunit RPN8/RPN11